MQQMMSQLRMCVLNEKWNLFFTDCFCFLTSSQDNEKRTPLHAAAYLGDAEIIELLILSGKHYTPAHLLS